MSAPVPRTTPPDSPPRGRRARRRRGGLPGVAALAAVVLLAGCGETPSDVLLRQTRGGAVSVQVDPVTGPSTPTYRWGGEPARSLVVTEAGTARVIWSLRPVDASEGFSGPVQHGAVPRGAEEVRASEILDADGTYRVQVRTLDGDRGSATFEP